MLNLFQLRTLVELGAVRNFSRTAEALHITQPAVTQQIRALEESLGAKLVDVIGRRAELTSIGAIVAERAVSLLAEAAALRRDISELCEAKRGVVRIGATVTIGGYILPKLLAGFRRKYPDIETHITIENTATLLPMIREGSVHLGLIEGEFTDDELLAEVFAQDQLVCIAPNAHRLARKRRVELEDLITEPFVLRELGSGTRAIFEDRLRSAGLRPLCVLSLSSSEAIVRSVEAGLGLSVLSRIVVADAIALGRISEVRVHQVRLSRELRLVRRPLHSALPAALRFAQFVLNSSN